MAVEYFKVTSFEPVVAYLTLHISRPLAQGKKVLWLVPGGSSIPIVVAIAKNLAKAETRNLTVSLTDERYGPAGHADSNWQQLLSAGFSLPGANLRPVLIGNNMDRITLHYAKTLGQDLKHSDYSVALAGIGIDGHTFGILPHSPAVVSNRIVVVYEGNDYVRLTPTLSLIKKLDEIVIYAVGEQKHKQLEMLDSNLSTDEQPAQLLKHLKKCLIFNDYKGEEL